MKVTKELKAKIERIFKEKRQAAWDEYEKKSKAAQANVREMLGVEIEDMCTNYPTFGASLKNLVYNNTYYGRNDKPPVTTKDIINFFANRDMGDPNGVLVAERKAECERLERQEEDLLIQIAYAENIGELQAIFAKLGIEW